MIAALERFQQNVVAFFQRYPWIGWAAWFAFCVATWLRTVPHRFGPTFTLYIRAAEKFWTGKHIYDLTQLGDYLYWPVSLVPFAPLYNINLITAALIVLLLSMVMLTAASVVLLRALFPERPMRDAVNLAGVLLMINIPAAWFNFKYLQASIPMTAAMMLAAAAIMRRHWVQSAFWLFVGIVVKPVAIVMVLLCGALQPRMRIPLAVALTAAVLLPFAFADANYVVGEYRDWIAKLDLINKAELRDWAYQSDFATMLDTIGITFPAGLRTAIRLAAALLTLGLAARLAWKQKPFVFAMGVTLLSGCYITLFGGRNEFLSFVILTPPLTALALIMLLRDGRDQRAWGLVIAALVLGFHWSLMIDRWLKPLLVSIIFIWMIWLTLKPERWRELLAPADPLRVAQ